MKRLINLVISIILLVGMLPVVPAVGITCQEDVVVTDIADSGAGSLRQAIVDVCSGGTITFDPGLLGATLTLDSQLNLDKDLTIDGSTLPSKVTISGNALTRVFWINSGKTITLDSLIIADGNADDEAVGGAFGGGIHNDGGALTVRNSIISNNDATFAGGGIYSYGGTVNVQYSTLVSNRSEDAGGGILNAGSCIMNVTDSTFLKNSAARGGGFYNEYSIATLHGSTLVGNSAATEPSSQWNQGGGILNIGGTMTVTNSTFTENTTQGWGNAIFNNAALTILNSTFSGNVGYYTLANVEFNAMLNFANNIIANTIGGRDCANLNNLDTVIIGTNINNLIETTDVSTYGTCRPTSGTQLSDDPMLSPLADNGGPTLTMALQPGSPAIDAGDNTICSAAPVNGVDQRGVTRPQNEFCDIGAYELLEFDILPHTLPPATVGFHYSQQLTAVGGTEPYSWSSIGLGEDPFTLISSTGMLVSDDNILDPAVPGDITFTAIWRDSTSVPFEKEYILSVYPALSFSPETLPSGKANQLYSQVITLSGGTAPYTINPVSLPDWASYDIDPNAGTITIYGTPTTFSDYEVDLQAEDMLGIKGEKTYKIWIAPEHAFTWSPELPNQFDQVTFTALPELGSSAMSWYLGEDCDEYMWVTGSSFSRDFYESGDFQVCLQYWVNAINDFAWEKQMVSINNIPPIDVYIDFDSYPILINSPVSAGISFFDWDVGPFTCTIDWGDGTPQETLPAGSYHGCEFPGHLYTVPGTYTVSGHVTEESVGSTTPTTVSLEVFDPALLPPVAWNDNWLVGNTGPSRIILEAFDIQGSEDLVFAIVDSPTYGSIELSDTVSCVYYEEWPDARVCSTAADYTPVEPAYTGSTVFTFTASDAGVTSEPAEINLEIAPNTAPTANEKSLTVPTNIPTKFTLTATDPDVVNWIPDHLTLEVVTPPTEGTIEIPRQADYETYFNSETGDYDVTYFWLVEYTPNESAADTDSFVFQVTDNNLHTSSAEVDLTLRVPVTWHVNVFDDDDDGVCDNTHCSLREAVGYAFNGDTVDFAELSGLPGEIVLNGDSIWINKDLIISGPGADQLAISGGAELEDEAPWEHDRIFTVSNYETPVNVTISGLTIKDGRESQGGGVQVSEGSTLTMNDCVIGPNNIVTYAGGGIFNDGARLTLNRCTVTENEGTGSLGGAGVTTAGGRAATTIINSTISGNITNNYGGGIYVGYGGQVNLVNTTVSGNISNENYLDPGEERGGGAGIYIDNDGAVQLQNSIVAGNTDMTDPATAGHAKWPDVYGNFASLGGNLIGNPTGSTNTWAPSDQVGTAETPLDPLLGALMINSPGHTLTMALLEGSPAIDAAPSCEVTIDQRSVERPQGSTCDIGAFELEQAPVFWEVFLPLIIDGSAD